MSKVLIFLDGILFTKWLVICRSMASKKSGLDDAKKRIQGKLSDISEQVKILHEIINSTKDEV